MNIQPISKQAYFLLHHGILAHARMEKAGMRVNVEYCKKKIDQLSATIAGAETKLKETKFYRHWERVYKQKTNLGSNHQLSYLLYTVKKVEPPKVTESGEKGATDEDTLSQLGIPEVLDLIRVRKLKKIRDTYLQAFLREAVNGQLHPFFNLHLTRSYRPSSDHPNFQNIPARDEEAMKICRRAILPRVGHQILDVDYASIEVLIACCYTQDAKLISDTIEGDMHGDMAIELFLLDHLNRKHPGERTLRQGAKNGFVFPQFYGDYYVNCAKHLLKWAKIAYIHDDTPALVHLSDKGLIRLNKAGDIVNADKFVKHVQKVEDGFWNIRYRTYTAWKKKWWHDYQKKGYIEMFTGFRCGGVMTRNQALNIAIQGTAFHCLLWSLIEIDKICYEKEKWGSRPIGQIHDSIIFDIDPKELQRTAKRVEQITCQDLPKVWDWIFVPLKIEMELCKVDQPWSTKKGWEHNGAHD